MWRGRPSRAALSSRPTNRVTMLPPTATVDPSFIAAADGVVAAASAGAGCDAVATVAVVVAVVVVDVVVVDVDVDVACVVVVG